jgi:pilus assembly protein CpaC
VKRNETELLVLVSPELVHPLEAEEAPAILPGMEVTEPTDCAFYFGGRIEGRTSCDHRSTVWPVSVQQALDARREAKRRGTYQACENYYIEGEHGFSQ